MIVAMGVEEEEVTLGEETETGAVVEVDMVAAETIEEAVAEGMTVEVEDMVVADMVVAEMTEVVVVGTKRFRQRTRSSCRASPQRQMSKTLNNSSEALELSSLTRRREQRRFGSTKIARLESARASVLSPMKILRPRSLLPSGSTTRNTHLAFPSR